MAGEGEIETVVAIRTTILGAALLALPLLAGPSAPAAAQAAGDCRNKVFVNSVYTNGVGQNQFEYFVQVQNRTQAPIVVTLTFGRMPRDVTLFSPTLPSVRLSPNQQETIRFGRGTSTNDLTLGRVQVVYGGGSPQPFVSLSSCRAA